ncbi:ABC transporter ATP-binding protein [Rhodopseudomonas palustris]|uniref:ABC transporter ATP-binding protein n=1 Tax=Rhodopseudomonas palustris TaxID=1076 RepID=A0A418V0M2_RHOPL|nr:ABC transporter ATP-binding protein [Rhodopseudomonas palustris]RJF69390.1 ABC transporter ATP-binding protein [Rhodopseudomonas palustris]
MPLLEVNSVSASYADGVEVLHGIDLAVNQGEMVTLIGANGAGKTTTLRAIMGLLRAQGSIKFDGVEILGRETPEIAKLGISMVPEGRGVFPGLSVYDNLRVATTPWIRRGQSAAEDLDRVFELFPILAERRKQLGWSLSGGQQQMLAIGRAIMARPKLMLLDEPSLGLAPNLVEEVFEKLRSINEQGVSILLVEQNAFMALEYSRLAYVIERGTVSKQMSSSALLDDEGIKAAYLGG